MQIASSKCRFINDSILCAKLKLIWLSGSKKYFIFQNSMEEKVFHLDDFSQNLLNKSPKDGALVMQVCIERKKMSKRNYWLKI